MPYIFSRQLGGKKGLTGYCFKYIDGPFCLQTDILNFSLHGCSTSSILDGFCTEYIFQLSDPVSSPGSNRIQSCTIRYAAPAISLCSQASENPLSVDRVLTLTVLVATIDAQWEGMGDVGSARYEPTLLPPCPTIRVLSYSN